MLRILPHELVELVLDYALRDDNDSALVYQTCTQLRDIMADNSCAALMITKRSLSGSERTESLAKSHF